MKISFSSIPWSQIKDVITSIGVLGTLTLGVFGLTTWWRQLRGTSKYDVARRSLLHTYKVQDAIAAVRSPMMFLAKREVEEFGELNAEMRIYDERMQRLFEQWAELRTVSHEARVFWREEADACFKPIGAIVRELRGHIWEHFWLKGAFAGPAMVDNNPTRVAANDAIVYQISEDDEFSKKVVAAVHQVESFVDQHIKR